MAALFTLLIASVTSSAAAQAAETDVVRVDLPVGRSFPISTPVSVVKISVAVPEVADVAVLGERDVVISAHGTGETDVILYLTNGSRMHYRVSVHSPADRQQIALYVKFAEVRRDVLRNIGVSALYRDKHARAGTGLFNTDAPLQTPGQITLPPETGYLSVLTDFNTDNLLAFIEAEEQSGNARILAEPNLLAANKDTATFLAGGELPIPIAQGGDAGGGARITIFFKEFGVRLKFVAEIISDSLVKLNVNPEVSTLDYANAITISGFSIPAFRTRRVNSTLDVRRNESLIISGMFDDDREKVKTGIPLLMQLPILGQLFSSTRFQHNETELLVVVTPVVIDPLHPRPRDLLRFAPDTTLPAREAIEKRLPVPAKAAPASPASRPPR
jgi:pilus assembly protein CpaC